MKKKEKKGKHRARTREHFCFPFKLDESRNPVEQIRVTEAELKVRPQVTVSLTAIQLHSKNLSNLEFLSFFVFISLAIPSVPFTSLAFPVSLTSVRIFSPKTTNIFLKVNYIVLSDICDFCEIISLANEFVNITSFQRKKQTYQFIRQ